jgi:hypothetical protein
MQLYILNNTDRKISRHLTYHMDLPSESPLFEYFSQNSINILRDHYIIQYTLNSQLRQAIRTFRPLTGIRNRHIIDRAHTRYFYMPL